MCPYIFWDDYPILEAVIDTDARASQSALQEEAVGTIDVMVVTDFGETESSREFIGSSPSHTGLKGHSVSAFRVEQTEVTAKVGKQEELLSDGAARVTEVRLKIQGVGRNFGYIAKNVDGSLIETIVGTNSEGPLAIEVIADFRSD